MATLETGDGGDFRVRYKVLNYLKFCRNTKKFY